MERLTDKAWRNFDPWECCGQDKYCQRVCHDPGGCTKGCIVPQLYARLGAYEDTGLTPGEVKSMQEEHFSGLEMAKLHSALMELKKYQEADKAGRLVVRPCKTRQKELLEQYPTADVDESGVLEVCPALLFASHRGKKGGCSTPNRSCGDCRKEFWGLWAEAALEAKKDE